MMERDLMNKITILACTPEKPARIHKIWERVVRLHHPFSPGMAQGELLNKVLALRSQGFLTKTGDLWHLPYAGKVELQDCIRQITDPWTPHKMFLVMAVGFFHLGGQIQLDSDTVAYIRDKMVMVNDFPTLERGEPMLWQFANQ